MKRRSPRSGSDLEKHTDDNGLRVNDDSMQTRMFYVSQVSDSKAVRTNRWWHVAFEKKGRRSIGHGSTEYKGGIEHLAKYHARSSDNHAIPARPHRRLHFAMSKGVLECASRTPFPASTMMVCCSVICLLQSGELLVLGDSVDKHPCRGHDKEPESPHARYVNLHSRHLSQTQAFSTYASPTSP